MPIIFSVIILVSSIVNVSWAGRLEREQCVVSNTMNDPTSPFAAFPDGLTLNHDIFWTDDGNYLIYANLSPQLDPTSIEGNSAPAFLEWSKGPSVCNGRRCTNESNFLFLKDLQTESDPQIFPQNWTSADFINEIGKQQTIYAFSFVPGFSVACESHKIEEAVFCGAVVSRMQELAEKRNQVANVNKVPISSIPNMSVCSLY